MDVREEEGVPEVVLQVELDGEGELGLARGSREGEQPEEEGVTC